MIPSSLRETIRSSFVGETLNGIERWKRFKTDETQEEWLDLLGPTAVVLSHQEYFTDFALKYLRHEATSGNISFKDLRILVYGFTGHDLGEAIVGDVSAPKKTENTEEAEALFALRIIEDLKLSGEEVSFLQEAYRQVVAGENATLHFIFKAFEKTEYVDTAMQAFRSLQAGKDFPQGWRLVSRVMAIDFPKVIEFAETLPNSIGLFLEENKDLIDKMLAQSEPHITEDISEKFHNTCQQWQAYNQ